MTKSGYKKKPSSIIIDKESKLRDEKLTRIDFRL